MSEPRTIRKMRRCPVYVDSVDVSCPAYDFDAVETTYTLFFDTRYLAIDEYGRCTQTAVRSKSEITEYNLPRYKCGDEWKG